MTPRRFTCIGGGTGLSTALTGVVRVDPAPTAVVSVVDDGGSSGRLVAERGGLPPGDLRKCLAALAPEDSPWRDLLEHRFAGDGVLSGHALGNLLLVALTERLGDLATGAARLGELIGCRGRVVPASPEPHVLVGETPTATVRGQEEVNRTPGIRRIRVEPPDPKAHPDAVDAIGRADVVVIGPGSLYTSVIPPFLIPGIREAVSEARGVRVFLANLAPQVAETRHLDLAGHVSAFLDHGGAADLVLFDPEAPLGPAPDLPLPTVPARLSDPANPTVHSPALLAAALLEALGGR